VYCDCGVLLCVGMGYRIRGFCVFGLWCALERRYDILFNGEFVYCDCGVLLCVGMGYRIREFVYFECGVLLCVGMGYCILEGLCVVTVVCCCASV